MKKSSRVLLFALAFACPLAGAAVAQTLPYENLPLLTVVGEGEIHARPDLAIINAGIISEAQTARAALAENSAAMTKMLNALRGAGIAPRDLQTSGFSVEPRYSQPPPDYNQAEPFVPQIVGYAVRNELSVRIRDLVKVGQLLDTIIAEGANSVSGPTFTVAEPSPLEDQARRVAMQDAIRRGTLYAQAAGVHLGPIFRIEEVAYRPPQPLPITAMPRMEAAADQSVPIESGELTFQVQVAVAWRIGG
jgi:uncharacterized protein